MPSPADTAARIERFLEGRAGRSAGNVTVRRELEIGKPRYWEARALLIEQGRARCGRGRGGSVRLVEVAPPAVEPSSMVEVKVRSFAELLGGGAPLALDDYQRPFVWTTDQVCTLARDLGAHTDGPTAHLDAYLGTLLVHDDRARGRRFLIDGQQRVSSLCLLHHRLTGSLPTGQALSYRAPESAQNLRAARRGLEGFELQADLLDRVCFTVITVRSEDLAFTFFDTQNNRGVQLAATDLLKAFHLRAIGGPEPARMQERCARMWERAQHVPLPDAGPDAFVQRLFEQVLWRSRRWTGQGRLAWESHGAIIDEFEARSLAAAPDQSVPVYVGGVLASGARVRVAADDQATVCDLPALSQVALADVPQAIRQPIHQGLGFFLFTERYTRQVERLFLHDPDAATAGMRAVDKMHAQAALSPYLRELYRLAVVMYVDRFGTVGLDALALWLDHRLGAVRLEKAAVFRATAMNVLREGKRNLLDVLAAAFRPEEVLAALREDPRFDSLYEERGDPDKGVRRRYADAVLAFYGQTGSLAGKRRWVEARVSGVDG